MKNDIFKKIHKLIKEFYQIPVDKFIPGKTLIRISTPCYDHHEINHLITTLLNGRISAGLKVKEFENSFSRYIGVKYGIAINSGTSANILALAVLIEAKKLKKGDEVILPATTFSSVVSPIIQLGLVPVYVDVDPITYNINPAEVKKAISPKTKAMIIVHSLGHPADIFKLLKIAKRYNLSVVEDCCEAHGAKYKNKKMGSFGDLSTFSFFVAHNITTGEGGMVLTNNFRYMKIARSLREFGRINSSKRFIYDKYLKNYDSKYIFERVGYNMRMTDLAASLGIEQLKKLNGLNWQRRRIVRFFRANLRKYEKFIQLPTELPNYYHCYYGFLMVVKDGSPFSRFQLVKHLEKNNIETRPFFAGCLPNQPAFRNSPKRIVGKLQTSNWLQNNAFFIGCHPQISLGGQQFVVRILIDFLDKKIEKMKL